MSTSFLMLLLLTPSQKADPIKCPGCGCTTGCSRWHNPAWPEADPRDDEPDGPDADTMPVQRYQYGSSTGVFRVQTRFRIDPSGRLEPLDIRFQRLDRPSPYPRSSYREAESRGYSPAPRGGYYNGGGGGRRPPPPRTFESRTPGPAPRAPAPRSGST